LNCFDNYRAVNLNQTDNPICSRQPQAFDDQAVSGNDLPIMSDVKRTKFNPPPSSFADNVTSTSTTTTSTSGGRQNAPQTDLVVLAGALVDALLAHKLVVVNCSTVLNFPKICITK
jgi:hypothetical protein